MTAWQLCYYWTDFRSDGGPIRQAKLVELVGRLLVFAVICLGSLAALLQHREVTWRAYAIAGGCFLQLVGLWTLTHHERHVLRAWDLRRSR